MFGHRAVHEAFSEAATNDGMGWDSRYCAENLEVRRLRLCQNVAKSLGFHAAILARYMGFCRSDVVLRLYRVRDLESH
jgi:hypothetical protein